MGMDPGRNLEGLHGQKSAGSVTEDRRVNFEGREIEGPLAGAVAAHPNYYPAVGRRSAGASAGWYSSRGGSRLVAGAWGLGFR